MAKNMAKNKTSSSPLTTGGYDVMIERLRWEGKPPKNHFEPPRFWDMSSMFHDYCKLSGNHCRENAHWSVIVKIVSLLFVIALTVFVTSVRLLPYTRYWYWWAIVFIWPILHIYFVTFFLVAKETWDAHSEVLRQKLNEIQTASAKELVVSFMRVRIEKCRELTLGNGPSSLTVFRSKCEDALKSLGGHNDIAERIDGTYRTFARFEAIPLSPTDSARQKTVILISAVSDRIAEIEATFVAYEKVVDEVCAMIEGVEKLEATEKLIPSVAKEVAVAKMRVFEQIVSFMSNLEQISARTTLNDLNFDDLEDSNAAAEFQAEQELEEESQRESSRRLASR